MSNSYETIRGEILTELTGHDVTSDDYAKALKALEAINKAEATQYRPEPPAPPEPTGAKAWFDRHSDALIRVGGSVTTVVMVGFVESKFDVIFRSKASKYL
jgi:hypothetical protein